MALQPNAHQQSYDCDPYVMQPYSPSAIRKHCPHCAACMYNSSHVNYEDDDAYVAEPYRSKSLDRNYNRSYYRMHSQAVDGDVYTTPVYRTHIDESDSDARPRYRTKYHVTYEDEDDDNVFDTQPYSDDAYSQRYEDDYTDDRSYWARPRQSKFTRTYSHTCPSPRRRSSSRQMYEDDYQDNMYKTYPCEYSYATEGHRQTRRRKSRHKFRESSPKTYSRSKSPFPE